MKKFLSYGVILLLMMGLFSGCSQTFNESVDVPWYPCTTGYTGASAVAMVAGYYGQVYWANDQSRIRDYILGSNGLASMTKMASFLTFYANCYSAVRNYSATDDGQNQALSLVVQAIETENTAILGLVDEHYVPIWRVEGEYVSQQPVASLIGFHAYDAAYQEISADVFKQLYFRPKNGKFPVIKAEYVDNDYYESQSNYQWFKNSNGTYYGAPANYVPTTMPIY